MRRDIMGIDMNLLFLEIIQNKLFKAKKVTIFNLVSPATFVY